MSIASPPPNAQRIACPCCGRYLGTVEGTYLELPPCVCGWQWTGRAVGKRARQTVQTPCGPIETKQRY